MSNRLIKHLTAILLTLFLLIPFTQPVQASSAGRGVQMVIRDVKGQEIALYKGSHALVIGASHYTAGWPSLRTVPGEMAAVKAVLEHQGFVVEMVSDPDGETLRNAFWSFINRFGYEPNNRLLFFFAGHGYTRREGQVGYLVPVDAPDPRIDEREFLQKALPMIQVMTWARQIEAKHALFLFDSCFSGTIFASRVLPSVPPHISDITGRPVRQFISAGDADQPVPAASVFAPTFVRALEGEADLNGDGYITGTELGMYIHQQVLHYQTGQTPQYGKIRDPRLDQGDFVFQVASSGVITKPPAPKSALRVTSNVSGARVTLDNQFIGIAAIEGFELSPGRYLVRVEKDGYEPFQRQVTITVGRMTSVHALLSTIQPRSGFLWVDTDPADAKVRILNIGPPYVPGIELAPGQYHIEVAAHNYETWVDWIDLVAGEDKLLAVRLLSVLPAAMPVEIPVETPLPRPAPAVVPDVVETPVAPPVQVPAPPAPTAVPAPAVPKPEAPPQAERESIPEDEIVFDNKTGLEWTAGPNQNITWHEARRWVTSLGGGWRLPTRNELGTLHQKVSDGAGLMTLFKVTAIRVWSGEIKDASDIWIYNFSGGEDWLRRDGRGDGTQFFDVRVLAVRVRE